MKIFAPDITGSLNIDGHITASGNISASGIVYADAFQSSALALAVVLPAVAV